MTVSVERAVLAAILLLAMAAPSHSQDPASFYAENCAACHTIGGGVQAGPDLKGVTSRRDREWLVRFLLDPEGVVKSGDPIATELVAAWDGTVMPATDGLSRPMAVALLGYIQSQSGEQAEPAPADAADIPFTEEDVQLGRSLFDGRERFEHGTAPCLACHDVSGSRAFGGGTLGPDLTQSFTRLGGRRGLQAWLEAPPTPLMRSVFRPAPLTVEEARALTAMLATAPDVRTADRQRRMAAFGASGAALTLAALGLAGFAWRRRFRAVRAPMVAAARISASIQPGGTR